MLAKIEPEIVVEDVCRAALLQLRNALELFQPWSLDLVPCHHEGQQMSLDGLGQPSFIFEGGEPSAEVISGVEDSLLANLTRSAFLYALGEGDLLVRDDWNLKRVSACPLGENWFCAMLRQLALWLDRDARERVILLADGISARMLLDVGGDLPTRDVAVLASVTPDHVNTLARAGKIKRLRRGTYDNDSVQRWLQARRRDESNPK